jgi:hypothetical protein
MKRVWMSFFAVAVATIAASAAVHAAGLPEAVGDCTSTSINAVGTRLMDGSTGQPVAGSGSTVSFDNGGSQVSYDTVAGIERSKPGDPVRMCLVSIPTGCPKNDNRGRVYRTTNLRTHEQWTLPDSQHMCGGA